MRTDPSRRLGVLSAALVLTGVAACSSSSSTTPTDTGKDSGATTADAGGTGLNPDGVPYPSPSAGYGHTARIGSTPGSVIQNFKFQGRLAGSTELTTISLADYYDPCNKRYKILHLSVAAGWCEPCTEETQAVVADLASSSSVLDKDKIVFIQALDDGVTEGVPATVTDLDNWISTYHSNFTEMLDPGLQNLAGFFVASSIPWNADFDVRTMEMLTSNTGWEGSVADEVAGGLAALPADPSYPIPASAKCPK
jgi:hypothetical protein